MRSWMVGLFMYCSVLTTCPPTRALPEAPSAHSRPSRTLRELWPRRLGGLFSWRERGGEQLGAEPVLARPLVSRAAEVFLRADLGVLLLLVTAQHRLELHLRS